MKRTYWSVNYLIVTPFGNDPAVAWFTNKSKADTFSVNELGAETPVKHIFTLGGKAQKNADDAIEKQGKRWNPTSFYECIYRVSGADGDSHRWFTDRKIAYDFAESDYHDEPRLRTIYEPSNIQYIRSMI